MLSLPQSCLSGHQYWFCPICLIHKHPSWATEFVLGHCTPQIGFDQVSRSYSQKMQFKFALWPKFGLQLLRTGKHRCGMQPASWKYPMVFLELPFKEKYLVRHWTMVWAGVHYIKGRVSTMLLEILLIHRTQSITVWRRNLNPQSPESFLYFHKKAVKDFCCCMF